MHGGKSTGAPTANQHALKHGIYARFMTVEELAFCDGVQLGKLDAEIMLARVQLARALKAEQTQATAPLEKSQEKISSIGGQRYVDTTYVRRDYRPDIRRLMVLIESLERTRSELAKAGAGGPEEPVEAIEIEVVRGKPVPHNG